ncbi:hypothetical protein [Bradyrhizobium sp. 6(2017)]|uniref:hypothetical protein n=1 Tax=Bradyrhizobium sp. 6(2017) TaxID=1197460 RepID=UPI0013E1E8D3|nr:hypothetical protein [Bradyrhizobium sp. 6(2017)]QIG91454.1 hypothetical protein G6P99_02250 [Bradyrhizobium sp. 6(2017)]
MSTNEFQSASLPTAGAVWIRSIRAKAVASETVQIISATARDALFAYATTGSALASVAIVVAPHLDILLRCAAHGRG